jgi:hypothetical protein
MKITLHLLSAILILFTRLAAAQIYPPDPGDFKLTASFDFVVEKQLMHSGNYIVHNEKSSGRIQICEDGVICETVDTTAMQPLKISTQPKLVFNRYGDKYFLSQIWLSDGTRLQLVPSPLESEVASTTVKPEAVDVNTNPLCIHMCKGLPPSWH